jgi:hypothetical protein
MKWYSLYSFMGSLAVLSVGLPSKLMDEVIMIQNGNIKAELFYQKEDFKLKNLRLKIVRSGKTLLDQVVPRKSEFDKLGERSFSVIDLDGDQEPEVIVNLFTGGAHCCFYSLIYRYQASQPKYTNNEFFWGDGAAIPQIIDLDGDEVPEFKSRDARFAYAFTSYSNSVFPLQVWQYRQGKMNDVTRSYPRYIKANIDANLQWLQKLRSEKREEKGAFAAYLADKYLLGEAKDGWQYLQKEYQGKDSKQYFTDLRNFLQKTNYIR